MWGRIIPVSLTQHRLLLVRHGETEWSLSGKHTSRTELDLTEHGREQAKAAGETLAGLKLNNPYVMSSPRKRAQVTAQLAGLSVDEVSARVALDEVMARMAPETEALIDELLPSWRSSAA